MAGVCPQKYVTGALAEAEIVAEKISEIIGEIEKPAQVEFDASEFEKFFGNESAFTTEELEVAMQTIMINAADVYDLLKIFELRERLIVAKVLIEHLKARRETRWAGFAQNLDFPDRDEKFNLFVNKALKYVLVIC